MRVYILDTKSKGLDQMLQWLSENEAVEGVEIFEDYGSFVSQAGGSSPCLCFIRIGKDMIPGLKAAAEIKQLNSENRIVFLSDGRDYALEAYEIGACGYLLSPLQKDKLCKCMAGLL